jgi:hypothetical protein
MLPAAQPTSLANPQVSHLWPVLEPHRAGPAKAPATMIHLTVNHPGRSRKVTAVLLTFFPYRLCLPQDSAVAVGARTKHAVLARAAIWVLVVFAVASALAAWRLPAARAPRLSLRERGRRSPTPGWSTSWPAPSPC